MPGQEVRSLSEPMSDDGCFGEAVKLRDTHLSSDVDIELSNVRFGILRVQCYHACLECNPSTEPENMACTWFGGFVPGR